MSWIDIDEGMIEKESEEQAERQQNAVIPDSGVYNVTIETAYLDKSQGGATSLNIKAVEDTGDPLGGRTIYWTTWLKSGNEKGNKSTYTDAQGNERPLPGWIPFQHLLKATGLSLKDIQSPEPVTIEKFNEKRGVGLLKPLIGKKAKAVIQQYEDDYTGEIKVKYDVLDWLNVDGTATGKGRDEEAWLKYLSKNPIKKIKQSKNTKKDDQSTEEVNEAIKGW